MVSMVQPHYENLGFPEPIDGLGKEDEGVLCTKRLLTMTLAPGKSVTKIGREIVAEYAASQGQTVKEFEADMREKAKDPAFFKEMLNAHVPTEREMQAYRAALKTRDWAWNVVRGVYNYTLGWVLPNFSYKHTRVPPNGPAIVRRLFDIHGYEMFFEGAFNADPHAGNIMLDEASGVISLIDYGQLVEVSPQDRKALAEFVIAVDDRDAARAVDAYTRLRCSVTYKPTGVTNDPDFVLAAALFDFGGAAGIVEGCKMLGFADITEASTSMEEIVELNTIDPKYVMAQRCCMCLQGVAMSLGCGGISPVAMLRPAAERYLAQHLDD